MTPRTLFTSLVLVLAAVAGVIVAVTAPAVVSGAFVIGAVSLGLATLSLLDVVRSVTGRPRASAGVWLGAAPIPVGMLWAAGALVQTVTAGLWSWKVALVAEAFGAAATAVVALVASAAAGAATRDEREAAATDDVEARVRLAARRVLEGSAGSPSRVRIEVAAGRILSAPRGSYGDAYEAEELESQLDELARALPGGNDAEVAVRLDRLERR